MYIFPEQQNMCILSWEILEGWKWKPENRRDFRYHLVPEQAPYLTDKNKRHKLIFWNSDNSKIQSEFNFFPIFLLHNRQMIDHIGVPATTQTQHIKSQTNNHLSQSTLHPVWLKAPPSPIANSFPKPITHKSYALNFPKSLDFRHFCLLSWPFLKRRGPTCSLPPDTIRSIDI